MIRLKALEILDYYDVPVLFLAEETDTRDKYLCSFVNEKENECQYIAVKITNDKLCKLKYQKAKIVDLFKDQATYIFSLNAESNSVIPAEILHGDVASFLPSSGYYIDPVELLCSDKRTVYRDILLEAVDFSTVINNVDLRKLREMISICIQDTSVILAPYHVVKKQDEVTFYEPKGALCSGGDSEWEKKTLAA